jgi:hypothetical protein
MAHPRGYEFVNWKSCPEMVEKDGSGLLPGTTNRLAKNARGYVVPSLGCRPQDCLLIERLGIKKETVHVEDDGSGYAGGLHIDTLVMLAVLMCRGSNLI